MLVRRGVSRPVAGQEPATGVEAKAVLQAPEGYAAMTCKCQCGCKLPAASEGLCGDCLTLWNMGSDQHGIPYVPPADVPLVKYEQIAPEVVDEAIDKAAGELGL
jgi:hypothetical protein